MQSIAHLRNVTKRFGSRVAVDDLSLSLEPGRVLGLLGPNGAGKSTTLRLLTGVLQPTEGTVEVLGSQPGPAVGAWLGYLPGELRLPRTATGRELARLHARLRGCDRPDHEPLARRLDLDLDRPAGALSTGNRRKLGIVLALQHRPHLVVLDEPTSGLDPLTQRTFIELVGELAATGAAVLFSSHVLSEVQAVADRVAMLRQGRLLAVDDRRALQARARQTIRLTLRRIDLERLTRSEGVVDIETIDGDVVVQVEGSPGDLLAAAAGLGITSIHAPGAQLEDAFHHLYGAPGRDATDLTTEVLS